VPVFRFSTGESFTPTHFSNMFALFPLSQYQVIETARDEVLMLIQPSRDAYSTKNLIRDIDTYVRAALPRVANVRVQSKHFSVQERFQRYISKMPSQGYG
jgi:hypothetical protein